MLCSPPHHHPCSHFRPCSPPAIGAPVHPYPLSLLLTTLFNNSQQPWCTYALHIATFTSLAFVVDPLLLISCWWGTERWNDNDRYTLLAAEIIFMFGFTKVVKLVGLFRKNPRDLIYLPVSILFGYFHGLIKLYALFTLKHVSHSEKNRRTWAINKTNRRRLADFMGKPRRW